MEPMWQPERLHAALAQLERGEVRISRELLHQALMQFAHPLSPFDDLDSKDRCREPWYRLATWDWLDPLLDIAHNPPLEDKYHPAFEEVWDIEVAELVAHIGRQDAAACVERVRPLLHSQEGRSVAISVMCGLATAEELERYLSPYLVSFNLSADEISNLAEAFATVREPAAQARFQTIRSFLNRDWAETREYLNDLNDCLERSRSQAVREL